MAEDSLFTKEGTVARSSQDIVRFFYLQRLEDLLRARKLFHSTNLNSGAFAGVKREYSSSLRSLFALCLPRMKSKDKNSYEYRPSIFENYLEDSNEESFEKATQFIISYLELDLKITDISKVQSYDRTNIILSNKVKAYK